MSGNKFKVLFWDIENTAQILYRWGFYDEGGTKMNVVQHSYLLSISWKWQHQKMIKGKSLADYPEFKEDFRNDYALCKEFLAIVDQADLVVAHNGNRFDVRKFNSRLAKLDLPGFPMAKLYDTCKVAKRLFHLPSYSLEFLCDYFGFGSKMKHGGFQLWIDCMAGLRSAFGLMKRYNKQDIVMLELLHNHLKKYDNAYPLNENLVKGTSDHCPKCHSDHIQFRGYAYNKSSKKHKIQCLDCFAWSHLPITGRGVIR